MNDLQVRSAQDPKGGSALLTGFFSPKGGTGQTFLLVNFAVALKAQGKRVLIYDADLVNPQAGFLAHAEEPELFSQFLSGQLSLERLIQRGLGGVDVLTLAGIENLDHFSVYESLHKELGSLFNRYDEVLIDIPTGAPLVHRIFLPLTDRAIIVSGPDYLSTRNLGAFIISLGAEKPKQEFELIFSRVFTPVQAAELFKNLTQSLTVENKNLKTTFLGYILDDAKRAFESIQKRTPVTLLDQSGSLSGCFSLIASQSVKKLHFRGRGSFIENFLKHRGV